MIKAFLKPIAILLAGLVFASVLFTASVYKENNNTEIAPPRDTEKALETVKKTERPYCVLVLGKDAASGLTDVMMLVSFDKAQNKIFVLQLPRDTYADYGASYYKLNGALRALGEDGICEFFQSSMGIEIDGYISLELEGFRALVDSIGGVEMNIEKPLKYSDPSQGLYIDIPSGRQTLDGKHAEMLVRYRSGYARGDLDRLDVQKRFLAALFATLKQKITPFNIYSIARSALPYLKTDISASELVSLGLKLALVNVSDVSLATIAGEDARSSISGGSFFVLSKDAAEEILRERFSLDADFDRDGKFLHPSLENFRKIYYQRVENKIFSIEELKN